MSIEKIKKITFTAIPFIILLFILGYMKVNNILVLSMIMAVLITSVFCTFFIETKKETNLSKNKDEILYAINSLDLVKTFELNNVNINAIFYGQSTVKKILQISDQKDTFNYLFCLFCELYFTLIFILYSAFEQNQTNPYIFELILIMAVVPIILVFIKNMNMNLRILDIITEIKGEKM